VTLKVGFAAVEREAAMQSDVAKRRTAVEFWKNDIYSPAKAVVQLYLVLPSGTSECERVFSDASFLQDSRQSRLDPGKFEDQVLFRRFVRDSDQFSLDGVLECAGRHTDLLPEHP
jgi:hypothetical protein